VIAGVLSGQLIGKQREHRRTNTDKQIRAHAGRPVFGFSFQTDNPA
jgi:hypothetical protein